MLDGTGGTTLTTDITGNITGTIDTVTDVTNAVTITANQDVNVAQISGDSTAADNLEAMLDGTGGTTLTTDITGDITGTIDTVTDVTNEVSADMVKISGDATAANNLEESATQVILSAVNDPGGAATTTVFITDLTEATDDHYKGRVVIFYGGGALDGQASDITAYNGTTKALTVSTLTDTPADNEKFMIV
jgi:hypothetical protein